MSKATIFYHEIPREELMTEEGRRRFFELTYGNIRGLHELVLDEKTLSEYHKIGTIDVEDYQLVFGRLQNITEEGHELNPDHTVRSMMVGDVIIFEGEGYIVSSIGYTKITEFWRLEHFLNQL